MQVIFTHIGIAYQQTLSLYYNTSIRLYMIKIKHTRRDGMYFIDVCTYTDKDILNFAWAWKNSLLIEQDLRA
jgi:hypothetical protein